MGRVHRFFGGFDTTCTGTAWHTSAMAAHAHAADHTEPERLRIRQLLDEPVFGGWTLLGGDDRSLDDELRWSIPLTHALNRTGSLSELAVFAEAHEVEIALAHIDDLARSGAAAVIVAGATGSLSRAPLPVVGVSRDIDFLTFSRLTGERVLSEEAHVRRYAMQVHDRIAALLHRGADLNSLIREVSAVSGLDAAILDTRSRVIAHGMGGTRQDKARKIALLQTHFAVSEQFNRNSLREERLYLASPHSTPVPLSPVSLVAWRIQMGPVAEGWLVLIPGVDHRAFPRHDLAQAKVLLEQSASIVATELVRQRSIVEAQERARGDFMQALVHGTYANKSELAARAEHHDFPLDSLYTVFVSHVGFGDSTTSEPEQAARKLSRLLPREGGHRTFATVLGGIIVAIRANPGARNAGGDGTGVKADAKEFAEAASAMLATELGEGAAVCYGSTALDPLAIRESYREARVALEVARSLGLRGGIPHDDIQAVSVLASIAGTSTGAQFVGRMLGPVRDHELAEELENTLSAYLGSGGNINETARRIHVHRNTMLSRIEKLSGLLGMDIRKPDNQFSLRLALQLDLLTAAQQKIAHEIAPPELYASGVRF